MLCLTRATGPSLDFWHMYQAKHLCLCYNYYVSVMQPLGFRHTYHENLLPMLRRILRHHQHVAPPAHVAMILQLIIVFLTLRVDIAARVARPLYCLLFMTSLVGKIGSVEVPQHKLYLC